MSASYKGEAVTRAFRALSCFRPDQSSWTLGDLASATGTPVETLRGILNTLVAQGMLIKDRGQDYRLGYAWLRLEALQRSRSDVRTVAAPLMKAMRDAINETIILNLRIGDQRVQIDSVESTRPVRRVAQIGKSGALHVGASGTALLSTLPADETKEYLARLKLSLPAKTYRSVERDLGNTQKSGFAVAAGTVAPDTATVAAAIRLQNGQSVALAISCPLERFTADLKKRSATIVVDAIAQLSARLGGRT